MTVSLTMDLFIVNLIIIILFLFIFGGLRWCVICRFQVCICHATFLQGCALRKLKRAQCSEPVKSGLPAYYDLYEKTTIFSPLRAKARATVLFQSTALPSSYSRCKFAHGNKFQLPKNKLFGQEASLHLHPLEKNQTKEIPFSITFKTLNKLAHLKALFLLSNCFQTLLHQSFQPGYQWVTSVTDIIIYNDSRDLTYTPFCFLCQVLNSWLNHVLI